MILTSPLNTNTKPRNLVLQIIFTSLSFALITAVEAQNPAPNPETLRKANTRPPETKTLRRDPFDDASVDKMSSQCVTLETEQGSILIEMLDRKSTCLNSSHIPLS